MLIGGASPQAYFTAASLQGMHVRCVVVMSYYIGIHIDKRLVLPRMQVVEYCHVIVLEPVEHSRGESSLYPNIPYLLFLLLLKMVEKLFHSSLPIVIIRQVTYAY